jgi:hypothetical protein
MPCCMYLIILFLNFKDTAACSLVQRFPNDHPFEVAKGRAYRSEEGELLHHVPIEPGNAKVSVEYVPPYTETIKLPYPPTTTSLPSMKHVALSSSGPRGTCCWIPSPHKVHIQVRH